MIDDTPTEIRDDDRLPIQEYRVLLLMADTEDRRLLAEWLEQQYTVTVGSTAACLDQEFDLCLVDEAIFPHLTDELVERKERAKPTFLPYVLVVDDRASGAVDQRVWDHVDELIATPVRPVELRGRLTGLLAQRHLSRSLAEREERIRRILKTIPDPLFILDRDGTVVDANPAFAEAVGRDSEAVAGTNLTAIAAFPSETTAELTRLADRAHASETASAEQRSADEQTASATDGDTITYRRPDGMVRHAEVGVSPLSATRVDGPRTLFVLRDVTDRLDRERALERECDRLDAFADMLAHEVRNPLNIAQGFLDQIEPANDSEETAMERVSAAHTRMEQMIKELLAHASGGLAGDVRTIDLVQVARIAWNQTPTGNAALELPAEGATIHADPESFQTILSNLFRNAMEHAGSEATVRVGSLAGGVFYVEDDGPGIPPEEREYVFQQGYTTNSAGTGLGLALVEQVAEAHGWVVSVTEGTDGGARFEFRSRSDADRSPSMPGDERFN